MKVAIVIGHTSNGDKGAYSETLKLSEYDYNLKVANHMKELNPSVYDVYTHTIQEYYNRQKAMADKLNAKAYDLVIELHYNAASPVANGTETLYYFNSAKGKAYAESISQEIVKEFGTSIRGVNGAKALVNKNDRGYYAVYLPKATALIVEPFFGSNPSESAKFADYKKYACVLNNTITKILK